MKIFNDWLLDLIGWHVATDPYSSKERGLRGSESNAEARFLIVRANTLAEAKSLLKARMKPSEVIEEIEVFNG